MALAWLAEACDFSLELWQEANSFQFCLCFLYWLLFFFLLDTWNSRRHLSPIIQQQLKGCTNTLVYQHQLQGVSNPLASSVENERMLQHPYLLACIGKRLQPPCSLQHAPAHPNHHVLISLWSSTLHSSIV